MSTTVEDLICGAVYGAHEFRNDATICECGQTERPSSTCLNLRYPEYGPCSTHGHEPGKRPCWYGPSGAGHTFDHGADTCRCGNVRRSQKQGIVIDLDHLRQRMAQFVAEVSPHDPTAYTIPFETYLQWEMRQQREKTNAKSNSDSQ
jgi:hypothetical protein